MAMQQPPRSAPRTGARGHPPRRGAGVSTPLVDTPPCSAPSTTGGSAGSSARPSTSATTSCSASTTGSSASTRCCRPGRRDVDGARGHPWYAESTITQMALHPLRRSSLLLGLLLASATEGRDFEDEEEDTGLPPTPPSSMEDGLPPPPKKELRLPRPKRHRREQKVERRTTAKRKAKRGW